LTFSAKEGLLLTDVMESYTINPQNDFPLSPGVTLSNCNFTATSIVRIQRLKVKCTLQIRDSVTLKFKDMTELEGCVIPSGMMAMTGSTSTKSPYQVVFTAYDPLQEYTPDVKKTSSIYLV
jgi:hypothetical protein